MSGKPNDSHFEFLHGHHYKMWIPVLDPKWHMTLKFEAQQTVIFCSERAYNIYTTKQ